MTDHIAAKRAKVDEDEKEERKVEEDYFVTLAIPDGTEIKIKRSILIAASSVFESMLDKKNWKEGNENKILIEEIPSVPIETCDFLAFFGRITQGHHRSHSWSIDAVHYIYAWAHYYQVEFIKEEAYDTLFDFVNKTDLDFQSLIAISSMCDTFELQTIKTALMQQKLPLTPDNYMDYYEMVTLNNLDGFIPQIVNFMAHKVEPVNHWPAELWIGVIRRLKAVRKKGRK